MDRTRPNKTTWLPAEMDQTRPEKDLAFPITTLHNNGTIWNNTIHPQQTPTIESIK
jgi:hypothetical protein